MLSIIIPVFNAQNTIKRCINSILEEKTCFHYEIIVVDDGSIDKSHEILLSFRKHHSDKIKVIMQENKGVSVARNRGIIEAKGKWVMFVDADDFLSKGWSKIVEKQMKTNSEFIVFSKEKIENPTSRDIIEMIVGLNATGHLSCVWSKLYLTSILKKEDINFHTNIINGEDILFNLEYYLKTKEINFCFGSIYNYYINNASATNRYNSDFLNSDNMYQEELKKLIKLIPENETKYIIEISILNAWLIFFERYSYRKSFNLNDLKKLVENSQYTKELENGFKYSEYFSKSKILILYFLYKKKYKLVFYLFKIRKLLKKPKQKYRIERI